MNIYILGPGATGKTTVGKIIAKKLKYKFFDLDEIYLSKIGDIGDEIKQVGYELYAYKNLELYKKIKEENQDDSVIILSSGFMAYDGTTHPDIKSIQDKINNYELSFMLMPSSNKDECVEIISKRQLERNFNSNDYNKHKKVIEKRFEIYKDMGNHQIFSIESPENIANEILDNLFKNERSRWNRFFEELDGEHPLASKYPDESLADYLENASGKPERVVDIGCGNGRNAVFMASLGCEVEAIDLSDDAIEKTNVFANDTNVNIKTKRMSFFDYTSKKKYDFVYDAGLFHHIFPHRRSNYIAKVSEVLEVGGILGLIAFNEKMGTKTSEEEIFKQRNMEGGISYPLEKLKQVFTDKFELISYRPMKNCKPDDKIFGHDFVSASFWKKL